MKLLRTVAMALATFSCALILTWDAAGQNPPANPLPQGTLIEGQVVKVVGDNQVLIRTSDGKEVLVNVTPQTKYMLTAKGGAFADLKPDAVIGIQYMPQNQLNMATQIVSLERVQGQIVKVIGKDQIVVKTSDGKEVIVYVSPETKYQLEATTPAPATPLPVPTFTDLQPGLPVQVYTQNDVIRTGPFGRRVIVSPRR
jgi:translation initiation factor IF-1